MPSRILREGINSSELVNSLSFEAELLYRRLMSVVDDYGRFYASPATVRGACWPTCPEKVCEQDVSRWISECAQIDISGKSLITIYTHGKAKYLQINNFCQQIRTKSRFPDPCNQPEINLISDCEQNACTSRISYFGDAMRISEAQCGAGAPAAAPVVCAPPETPKPKNTTPIRASDMSGRESRRWEDFREKYPRKVKLDLAAQQFISTVTVENESAVFACLDRYLASDEVSRGIVMNPDNWLREQHRTGWRSDWPRAPERGGTASDVIADIKRSLREKEAKRVG